MSDKEKIVTVNGKKSIEKTFSNWCDEPFRYYEELPKKADNKKSDK